MITRTLVKKDEQVFCRLFYKRICTSLDLSALSDCFARQKFASILGGNPAKKDAGRFSYWTARPKEIFEFWPGQKKPFEILHHVLNKYKLSDNFDIALPRGIFVGGWIGYFSYELARYIEKLPQSTADDLQMPLIRLCFYDRLIAYDHKAKTFWLMALQLPADTQKPEEKLAELGKFMAEAKQICVAEPAAADIDDIDFSQIRSNMDKDYYLRCVEKIRRYIYDGQVYQVNFSQRFECDYKAEPIKLFNWQNRFNSSGYAAYIDGGSFAIVSASPEMFVTIDNGLISTKPIKGTRPRVSNTGEGRTINTKNFNELVRSEKEQAELNMIIDLERNDIAKICVPGTRKVVQPRTIESYPTVFHAVATIEGQLRDDVSFCDVLRAMFPGGSITGAPKVSAMEIIDQTEPTQRSVYTGSIGFLGLDGSVSLNIAIRTIIIKGGKAYVQTGGGIVADSEPQAEWDETITKAKALLAGIKSINNTG